MSLKGCNAKQVASLVLESCLISHLLLLFFFLDEFVIIAMYYLHLCENLCKDMSDFFNLNKASSRLMTAYDLTLNSNASENARASLLPFLIVKDIH